VQWTWQAIKPDLIRLIDDAGTDGFPVMQNHACYTGHKFTPIIIITALDDTDSRLVAFGAGANDYLTKPFHVGDLLQKMKDFLE
jgi:DNA-binding response OmpR family regulator